mgnify:CR=1 FL=1
MDIILVPQRRDDEQVVSVLGDVLTINGVVYDFSPLGEGDSLGADAFDEGGLVLGAKRSGGKLTITMILALGAEASEAARFPHPLTDVADGPLELPQ